VKRKKPVDKFSGLVAGGAKLPLTTVLSGGIQWTYCCLRVK